MEIIESLSKEKLERYRERGLTDREIELLNTPMNLLDRSQLMEAVHAKDKM